jgi:hypothetical protein
VLIHEPGARPSKAELAERIRQVRWDLFGADGSPELARRLGVPAQTWLNYERGVTIPAEILVVFLELTAVEPRWLLTGRGPRFRSPPVDRATPRPS